MVSAGVERRRIEWTHEGAAVRVKGLARDGKVLDVADAVARVGRVAGGRQVLFRPQSFFFGRRGLSARGAIRLAMESKNHVVTTSAGRAYRQIDTAVVDD